MRHGVQVSEVKNIMVDNIEKVLERGEKIELLVDKTDNLRFQVCWTSVCQGLSRARHVHDVTCARGPASDLITRCSLRRKPRCADMVSCRPISSTKQESSCAARCGGRTCGSRSWSSSW